MGTIINHAIIVTGHNVWTLTVAREKAIELELKCCEPVHHKTNGEATFLVIPDGSKEGWERSNKENTQRAKFIEFLHTRRGLYWLEVSYSPDSGRTAITDHAWKEE